MNLRPEFGDQTPDLPLSSTGDAELLEAVADGVIMLRRTSDGVAVTWVSQRFESSTGLAGARLLGRAPTFLRRVMPDGATQPIETLLAAQVASAPALVLTPRGERAAFVSARTRPGRVQAALLTVTLVELDSVPRNPLWGHLAAGAPATVRAAAPTGVPDGAAAGGAGDHRPLATDGVRAGFFEYDVATGSIVISEEWYRLCRRPVGQLADAAAVEVLLAVHPADEATVRAGWAALVAGPGSDWDAEFRLSTGDGDWVWVNQRARALDRDPAGRARRIVGIVLDIDRRKRAEHGLAQSEARYRTVVAMQPGFVHESVLAADGRLLLQWASEGFTRVLGWTVAEVNERGGLPALIHPEFATASNARRAAVLAGEPVHGEVRILAKSGAWIWFSASAFPLEDPETGAVCAFMGSLHDITGLKLTEERLRSSEERFRLAAAAVHGIIYERDTASNVVTCSSGVREVLGLGSNATEARLDYWLERIHPEDAERFAAERIHADDGSSATTSQYRLRHADGHYVDVLDHAIRLRDAAGRVTRVIGCAMDVSGERRVERLLGETQALAHIGSWEVDLRTQQVTWSDEAYRIHGMSRDTFQPSVTAALAFYAPESQPIVRRAIRRAIETGEGFDRDVEMLMPGGGRRWVRVSGRAEAIGGATVRLYGAIQDIEALKRSEMRIQQQSDWLRLAMDAAQVLAWRWYPAGDRLVTEYRSPAFDPSLRLAATLAEDLAGVCEQDRERVRAALERTVERGEPADLEFRVSDTSGRTRWLVTRAIRATDDGGVLAIGATYEVTARRAAEDALRASESVLRSVSENSPDYIFVTDRNLNVTFINRERSDRNVPVRQDAASLNGPVATSASAEFEERLRRVIATGRPLRFESRGHRADGSEALFEHRIGPVEQGGGVAGAIVYTTDITDRRALEREILEISNREQRRIGSDLHDGLGQELTGIALLLRGVASSIGRGVPPRSAELEEVLGLVNGAIETTRTLARGLSPVALEGGGLVEALRALVARTRAIYGLDIRFRSRVASRITLDAAATGHLYRIAQESLTNTARHARAKKAAVYLTARGVRVVLTVIDDGRGLSSRSASGMGLKIMRYRAHMLGGELEIGAGPGDAGTRVSCQVLQPDPYAAADQQAAGNA